MRYYLAPNCVIKLLETPGVYDIEADEFYELDNEALEFITACARPEGSEDMQAPDDFTRFCVNEGILTTGPGRATHPPINQAHLPSPKPSLRYLELQITRRCNLSCAHCFLGKAENTDLSVKSVLKVLREFEHMQGLRALITGGEPLMHPDFKEINSALPEFALRKILLTNGHLLTRETIKGLNVNEIQVSIDGMERAHDALRGKGSYKKAMGALKLALAIGIDASVSTMVHTGNLGDFDDMENQFRGMNVKDWAVDIPCLEGNLRNNKSFTLPPEVAGEYLDYGFGEGLHGGGAGYACGHHLMTVTAGGKCAKCSFYEDSPVGHIDEGLLKCWKRVEHIELKRLDCDCDVIESCKGGCRYRAAQLTTPLGKDLYRCHFYGKI